MKLAEHPTVVAVRDREAKQPTAAPLDAAWLRKLCLDSGADDCGFVALDREEMAPQRETILNVFPHARFLVSIVCRMNREPIRSPARSVSNLEFHQTTDHANEVARTIVRRLEDLGVPAFNPASGFPMEMADFPRKIWTVSHKPVAVAAGMGKMGIHRNVIHPRFGNFILLGTILVGADIVEQSQPLDYNPCLECKLCVAACPVGAVKTDGVFDFASCLTHNYREFMFGFNEWVEKIADSPHAVGYRRRVTDAESASMWQSLAFGPNYKAAYCLAVCPAGEEVIGPFLKDRAAYVSTVLKPLQQKVETIYATPGSDAEEHVRSRFPHKEVRKAGGLRPTSVASFLEGMPNLFQRGQSKGLAAVYHFRFTGPETADCTVEICDGKLSIAVGLVGTPDLTVTADSATWVAFLRKEANIVWAIVRRKVRLKGPLRLLVAFGKCFPS